MKELSLNILDIAMNSVRARAKNVSIAIDEDDERLSFTIADDGCGMGAEQVKRLSDPFYTTRETRKVGLGVPFLTLAAQQTGGNVSVTSRLEAESPDDHGTEITAVFNKRHIDFTPLGDVVSTVLTLVQGNPEIDIAFTHNTPNGLVSADTRDIRRILGDDVPLNSFEVLDWLKEYLLEQYNETNNL